MQVDAQTQITSAICLCIVALILSSYKPALASVLVIIISAMALRSLGVSRESFAKLLADRGLTPSYKDQPRKGAIIRALAAFRQYKSHANQELTRKQMLYSKLSSSQKSLAASTGYTERQKLLRQDVQFNQRFLDEIVDYGKKEYDITDAELVLSREDSYYRVVELLGHLQRDWSVETKSERSTLMQPILSALKEYGPKQGNILVPGSGLAAVAYELAKLGYDVDACEYSGLMDITAQYLVNQSSASEISAIYPFVSETSHLYSTETQTRKVDLIRPERVMENLHLKFGDFTKLTKETKRYDVIISVFFVDTAENVFTYLDAIKTLLKPTGVWINYGPLKWGSAPKIEFTYEELLSVIQQTGWSIEKRFSGENIYIPNKTSMWNGVYRLEGIVAQPKA